MVEAVIVIVESLPITRTSFSDSLGKSWRGCSVGLRSCRDPVVDGGKSSGSKKVMEMPVKLSGVYYTAVIPLNLKFISFKNQVAKVSNYKSYRTLK